MSKIIASLTNGDFTTQVQLQEGGTYSVLKISNDQVIERLEPLPTLSDAMVQVLEAWAAEFEGDDQSTYVMVNSTVRPG